MKQGNKMGILNKLLSSFRTQGVDHKLDQGVNTIPTRGRNKVRRIHIRNFNRLYKPAMSTGFRGSPRSSIRPGHIPAPTLDQVRDREIKYNTRLTVKKGLMYFKEDNKLFSQEEAMKRQHNAISIELITNSETGVIPIC